MKKILIYSALIIMLLAACQRAEECLNASGPLVSREYAMADIQTLVVEDDVEIHLIQSVEEKVVLYYAEGWMQAVELDLNSDTLSIRNTTNCLSFRAKNKPKLEIYSQTLRNIQHRGSGEIRNVNELDKETFNINVRNASGDVHLSGVFQQLNITNNSISNIYLKGEATRLNVGFFFNEGRLLAYDLTAQEVNVIHRGHNDLQLQVQQRLSGKIEMDGNVYYRGYPTQIEVSAPWRGRLISAN